MLCSLSLSSEEEKISAKVHYYTVVTVERFTHFKGTYQQIFISYQCYTCV